MPKHKTVVYRSVSTLESFHNAYLSPLLFLILLAPCLHRSLRLYVMCPSLIESDRGLEVHHSTLTTARP